MIPSGCWWVSVRCAPSFRQLPRLSGLGCGSTRRAAGERSFRRNKRPELAEGARRKVVGGAGGRSPLDAWPRPARRSSSRNEAEDPGLWAHACGAGKVRTARAAVNRMTPVRRAVERRGGLRAHSRQARLGSFRCTGRGTPAGTSRISVSPVVGRLQVHSWPADRRWRSQLLLLFC